MVMTEATLIEIADPSAVERPNSGRSARRNGRRREAAPARNRARSANSGLQRELRQFVASHPQGWGHADWLGLLDGLRERGHEIGDADEVGRALERERLTLALQGVRGLGPQRLGTLLDRYGTLWNLRQADDEAIAGAARLSRPLAERVRQAVNS